jgi:hypothetical protein
LEGGRYNNIPMDSLEVLLPAVHPVDREVLSLWMHPALAEPARRVLYGYRYWPRMKAAVLSTAHADLPFVDRVMHAADAATRTARVDADLLIGITAAAMEMCDRLGREVFAAGPSEPALSESALLETPTMILRRRARNRPEGILGALPGVQPRWCVTREPDPNDTYVVGDGDALAPCRGGSHERCAVGVVAGADRLSPMREGDPFPLVRRACETRVFGRVSLLAAL